MNDSLNMLVPKIGRVIDLARVGRPFGFQKATVDLHFVADVKVLQLPGDGQLSPPGSRKPIILGHEVRDLEHRVSRIRGGK